MFDSIEFSFKSIIREKRLINFDSYIPNSIMFYPILFLYKSSIREER